jgi:hypothetical protein
MVLQGSCTKIIEVREDIMPTLTEEDVFTFDQLSDEAKDKARDWMRGLESGDFDTEFLYVDFQETAWILGISFDVNTDLHWSGFSSQGDGASFSGHYYHSPNASAKIREERPEDTGLHAIADGLQAIQVGYRLLSGHTVNAKISADGRHSHEMTMQVDTLEDSETGEELEWGDSYSSIEKRVLELMRDFARWMYKELEQEYNYRQSDAYIDECLDGCEFD